MNDPEYPLKQLPYDINKIPKVLIPMIRRTFPKLIPAEIVGVQPMSKPVRKRKKK